METENQSYLMFRHGDALYGVEAHRVREIFQLPELTLIADAPRDILGSLNWRGKVLPVMHLDLRLGQPMTPCQLSDSIIVLDCQGIQVGMVVHQVLDVQTITGQEAAPDYGREQQISTAFVAGLAKMDDELVVLLQPETLIRQADSVAMMIWEAALEQDEDADASPEEAWQATVVAAQTGSNFYDRYCGSLTDADRQIFRQRAEELRPRLEEGEQSDRMPLAVIGLGDNYYALDLGTVREFITVPPVTPIPCCPDHIVGNINLRGEVMTLVDIRAVLNTEAATAGVAKAIVVEVDDVVAGIPVDSVFDVLYLPRTEIAEVPIATEQQDFFHGVATYQDRHLSILNLPNVLAKGRLMVDQGTAS